MSKVVVMAEAVEVVAPDLHGFSTIPQSGFSGRYDLEGEDMQVKPSPPSHPKAHMHGCRSTAKTSGYKL